MEIGRYTPKEYISSEVDPDETAVPEKRTILAPAGAVFPDGFEITPIEAKTIVEALTKALDIPSGNLLITVKDEDLQFVVHNLPTFVGLNLVLYMDAPNMEYQRAWYMHATTLPSITPQEIEHEVKVVRAKARPARPQRDEQPEHRSRRPFSTQSEKPRDADRAAFQEPEGLDATDED